jgi:hypothetical protein
LAVGDAPSSYGLGIFLSLRFKVELKWFLIALSVQPGRSLLIFAHLLPNSV